MTQIMNKSSAGANIKNQKISINCAKIYLLIYQGGWQVLETYDYHDNGMFYKVTKTTRASWLPRQHVLHGYQDACSTWLPR